MYGSIPDWGELYKKAFRHLKSGGWLQGVEGECKLQTDHVDLPKDHIFNTWGDLFCDAGYKMGRTSAVACDHQMRDHMEAVGFTNIAEKKVKAPTHGWPEDPKLQHVGLLIQACLDESLEGFALFAFTQVLGWQKEEVQVLVAKMRKEMRRKDLHAYVGM